MNPERRLIQDAPPGDLRHRLLRAGREATPTVESRQRLLGALVPPVDAPALQAGPSKANVKAVAGASKATLAVKFAVLSVVGAAGTAAWFAAGARSDIGFASGIAPAAPASKTLVSPPAVQEEPGGRGASPGIVAARNGVPPSLRAAEPEPGLVARAPLPRVQPQAAPGSHAVLHPRALVARNALRQRQARATRAAALDPKKEVAAAEARPDPEVPHGSAKSASEPGSVQQSSSTLRSELTADAPLTEPPRAAVTSSGSAPVDTHLRDELRELDAVRDAVRNGDRASARERLDAYFRRFPHGVLAPEALRLAQRVRGIAAP